jgi:hypothetical protein
VALLLILRVRHVFWQGTVKRLAGARPARTGLEV